MSNGWEARDLILIFDALVQPGEETRDVIDGREYRMSPVEVTNLHLDE
jgi:hypothetical protein